MADGETPIPASAGTSEPTRIVILGGGFAGAATAIELERRLRPADRVRITLVNRENFTLFTPMLHEVAASDVDITHIVNPLRKLVRRTRVFAGHVEQIDLESRVVRVAHGPDAHAHELRYDHLVIALGSVTNFYGIPGLAAHALTMKSLGDAVTLRNRLIRRLEEADQECAAAMRAELLTFVVAGAGFAGVETAAAANDFLRESIRFYPRLSERDVRVVLVDIAPRILTELDERLGAYARAKLERRHVEIRLQTGVTAVTDRDVILSDGARIAARNVIWTAGVSPNPLLPGLPCTTERGRLVTDSYMRVPRWPGVWALGDCAAVPDLRAGRACPPTAQHATRQGRTLARNLIATLRGDQPAAFDFATLGQLAAIGRRTGVASILGLRFSGFIAWFLWRTIYLAKLPRLEKKLRVALDWTLDLIFTKDLAELGEARAEPAGQRVSLPVPATGPASNGTRQLRNPEAAVRA